MELREIKSKIDGALNELYAIDLFLIENNLCERSINHRFSMHLQTIFKNHFVDCEYNISHLNGENNPKVVSNIHGNYIDIIVTKRDKNPKNDFLCFEVKKWNNTRGREKDVNNLIALTKGDRFCYKYGFYIIFGKNRQGTKIQVFKNGRNIENE